MTTPQPLDLDAAMVRYATTVHQTWRQEHHETEEDYEARVHSEQRAILLQSVADVPALVAEIKHLRGLLEAEGIWYQDDDEQPPAAVPFDGPEGFIDVKKRKGVKEWVLTCSEHGEVGRYPIELALQTGSGALLPEQAWDKHIIEKHPEVPVEDAPEPEAAASGLDRDPDWYIAQQAADVAFHRMGESP